MKTETKEWFKEWFDTKYYHLLYKHRSNQEAEIFISNLATKLGIQKHTRVWDLACGKGRHSIALNKLGFQVCGTDLSRESIHIARQFENETLSFFELDMRSPFRVNYFDVVMNLFTSFGYFDKKSDDLKVLQSVSNSLKQNGLFVFDYLNPKSIHIDQAQVVVKDKVKFTITKEMKDNAIIKHIRVDDRNEQYNFYESVKLYQPEEIIELANQVNLKKINLFGDYELNTFDPNKSPRMIFVFEKQ
jgi:SAM-dependent methyltransferase